MAAGDMLEGWLHLVRGPVCTHDDRWNQDLVVVRNNDNMPTMFYTDTNTAVQGPASLPSQWQMVVAD